MIISPGVKPVNPAGLFPIIKPRGKAQPHHPQQRRSLLQDAELGIKKIEHTITHFWSRWF